VLLVFDTHTQVAADHATSSASASSAAAR